MLLLFSHSNLVSLYNQISSWLLYVFFKGYAFGRIPSGDQNLLILT